MKHYSPFVLIRLAVILLALGAAGYLTGPMGIWHLLVRVFDFIIIISVIVFIHEGGHYLVAKWAGVKVETFSIGFGHEIFGWNDRSGTRWKISALPFGGYVKMFGDATEASTISEEIDKLSEEDKKLTFYHKPLYKKSAIVAAGPIFNFILTIVILTGFALTSGLTIIDPVIGEVIKGSAAEQAGLQTDDRVMTINGESISRFSDIQRILLPNLETPVMLVIKRGDTLQEKTIIPRTITEKDDFGNVIKHPIIGIKPKKIEVNTHVSFFFAVHEAVRATYEQCVMTLQVVGQLILGERNVKETITGPVGLVNSSGQAVERGLFFIFTFMATLSVNLGLINLFPIPPLDGGHLLYYGIEAIIRRPLPTKAKEYGMRVGIALVAMLMTYAVINDINKILQGLVKNDKAHIMQEHDKK